MKIFIKAKTQAKEPKIEKTSENHFQVCVKEPAREGKANQAIIKAMAEYFGINQSAFKLISGTRSKNKIFETG